MKFKKLFSVLCSFTMMISSIFCCKADPVSQKIVFLGEAKVGKTQIVNRWVNNKFDDSYEATVGMRFYKVSINAGLEDMIWDLAGEEKYRSLLPTYCRGASIAVIVVDLTNDESINGISEFISRTKDPKFDANFGKNFDTKILLVGNKSDLLAKSELDIQLGKLRNEAKKNNIDDKDVIAVSAKTGGNIDTLVNIINGLFPGLPTIDGDLTKSASDTSNIGTSNKSSGIFKENKSKIPTQNNGLTKSTSDTSNIGTSNKYSKYLTGAGLVALIAGTGLLIKKHFTSNDTQKNESL